MNKEQQIKRAKILKKLILQEHHQAKFDEFKSSKVAYNRIMKIIHNYKPTMIEQIEFVLAEYKTFTAAFINQLHEVLTPKASVLRGFEPSSETTNPSQETILDLLQFMNDNKLYWFPARIYKTSEHHLVVKLYAGDDLINKLPPVTLDSNLKGAEVTKITVISPHLIALNIKSKKKIPKLEKLSLHIDQEVSEPNKIVLVINKTI